MSTQQTEPKVELEVKNFGPIGEAKIDLRPLTVFVGPSNTGKTYLATLIYALHNFFAGTYLYPAGGVGRRFIRHRYAPRQQTLTQAELNAIDEWLKDMSQPPLGSAEYSSDPPQAPDAVTSVLVNAIAGFFADDRDFTEELVRCFGLSEAITEIVREKSRRSASIELGFHDSGPTGEENKVVWRAAIGSSERTVSIARPSAWRFNIPTPQAIEWAAQIGHKGETSGHLANVEPREYLSSFVSEMAIELLPQVVSSMSAPAHYLPADRAGVMHAHRSIVGAIVRSAPRAALGPMGDIPSVSGVVADFLERLISIDDRRSTMAFRQRSRALGSDRAIEEDILEGTIQQTQSETDYPSFYYRPSGWQRDLPLMNTSSMVTELAPVVLFARHFLASGHTLFVDEPESHLHPAIQAEFARQLARLVHRGVRVVVTTHSNWIVDEFSNIVKMSELSPESRYDLPAGDAALSPAEVGMWSFAPTNADDGSRVIEMMFDSSGLGYDAGYLKIADAQYRTWATIANRLADEEP